MDRKQTAWKKSRKFGDVYGGRGSPKICDRIFNRAHSLSPPSQLDRLPIYVVDNPARDFFFPLQPDEIARELQQLPALKNFYVETLLYHEIGHHVDWYRRHWTSANRAEREEYANQYAFEHTSSRRRTYSDPIEPKYPLSE
jgi:hypothetical protein